MKKSFPLSERIAKSGFWETTTGNLPLIFALFVVLMLCTYVPAIPLTLAAPNGPGLNRIDSAT